jgi:two-component system, NtrC family, sensor kinase
MTNLGQTVAELEQRLQASSVERDKALSHQATTSDILRLISQSPTDVRPVFDAIVRTAVRLLGCDMAFLLRCDGTTYSPAAVATSESMEPGPANLPIDPGTNFSSRAIVEKKMLHLPDWSRIDLPQHERQIREIHGVNSALYLPLLRNEECIGLFALAGKRPRIFGESEIAVAESLRDHALIALENVRLFNEARGARERQTATAEILKVIASSPSDVQPVFDAIAERANRLIEGLSTAVYSLVDDALHLSSFTRVSPAADAALKASFPKPLSAFPWGEQIRNREIVHIPDVDVEWAGVPSLREMARLRGFRGVLIVPLLRDRAPIGVVTVSRAEPGIFAAHHVQLLQTFADQAVIAIENVRLFDEVQAKTSDLSEALQQQTATADVLKVISRSAFDLDTVMNTLSRSASELCEAEVSALFLRDGNHLVARGVSDIEGKLVDFVRETPVQIDDETYLGRAVLRGSIANIPDFEKDTNTKLRAFQKALGFKSTLIVPLIRDGRGIGAFAVCRNHVGVFSQRQIEIVQAFADQAVIAIENVRLFDEVQARTKDLAASLHELRSAQDRLVQTEKLASLGQLTAGIAHEIKNPLNFVNNFSALSAELTDELNDVLKSAALSGKIREEVDDLTQMLKDNLEKVVQHGKRADSIVKNMLLHSHEGSGEHRLADINALLDQSLNLAYHGARAENPKFNVTLRRDFDETAGLIETFPQEIIRVFLNLISNGFYAMTKRRTENGGSGFEPVLSATTRNLGETVEIGIRDNGTGIPAEVKEKMFNPFFTTKPAGEGTGLGLSMSHDIVAKQHGGTIDVDTELGQFTELKIILPRKILR